MGPFWKKKERKVHSGKSHMDLDLPRSFEKQNLARTFCHLAFLAFHFRRWILETRVALSAFRFQRRPRLETERGEKEKEEEDGWQQRWLSAIYVTPVILFPSCFPSFSHCHFYVHFLMLLFSFSDHLCENKMDETRLSAMLTRIQEVRLKSWILDKIHQS